MEIELELCTNVLFEYWLRFGASQWMEVVQDAEPTGNGSPPGRTDVGEGSAGHLWWANSSLKSSSSLKV